MHIFQNAYNIFHTYILNNKSFPGWSNIWLDPCQRSHSLTFFGSKIFLELSDTVSGRILCVEAQWIQNILVRNASHFPYDYFRQLQNLLSIRKFLTPSITIAFEVWSTIKAQHQNKNQSIFSWRYLINQ